MALRILVICYSQTGQLTRIVRSMLAPLGGRDDVQIHWHEIVPRPAFPFPWSFLGFLDAFPESVYLDPPAVEPGGLGDDYDLIVLAYQVWFLAPSLPVTGFLRSPEAGLLRGKRVVTVIGCRNMWTTAHRSMVDLLENLGARITDNVVFTDSGPMWSTFITTPWWLLTGNKGPLLGVFPEAGVSARDIGRASRFGRALADALPDIARGAPGPFLHGLAAVKINRHTMLAERIGHRSFRIWGRLLRALGPPGSATRKPVLAIYAVFLVAMIVTALPVTAAIAFMFARFSDRVRERAEVLEAPSGSSGERLAAYDR
ncbi:MAG: dialkylresorcinol condensing enzyme [Burkholderiales bacterium]